MAAIPKKPMYTPEDLIKKGLFTAGQLLMQLFMKKNTKPSQKDQRRGGNAQGNSQVLIKHKNQPDGTTKAVQVAVESIAPDINKILRNPDYTGKIEFQEYIGPYHVYPNGAIYSGAEYSDESVQLMPYAPQVNPAPRVDELAAPDRFSRTRQVTDTPERPLRTENNTIYFQLTKRRFDLHYQPKAHYPMPTEQDYRRGFLRRFFVQRINDEVDITEVSATEFDKFNKSNNPGVDGGLYNRKVVNWSIVGDISQVTKVNERVVLDSEVEMPGIVNFLTDYTELHKKKEREFIPAEQQLKKEADGNLADRQYPDGETIHVYLPKSYALPNMELGVYAQNCGNCWFRNNNNCGKWKANIRNAFWCKSWRSAQGLKSDGELTNASQQANQDIEQLRIEQERARRENRRRESEEIARRQELLRRAEESGENSIIQPPAGEGEQTLPDVFNPPPPSPPYPPPSQEPLPPPTPPPGLGGIFGSG